MLSSDVILLRDIIKELQQIFYDFARNQIEIIEKSCKVSFLEIFDSANINPNGQVQLLEITRNIQSSVSADDIKLILALLHPNEKKLISSSSIQSFLVEYTSKKKVLKL